MSASTAETSRVRRAYVWILAVVVLLFLALTGFWYWAASRLEAETNRAIENARLQGVEIGCPSKEIFGYPFRLGLRCTALTIDARGDDFQLTAGAVRSAAQIYRPNRVVGELDGPMIVNTAPLPRLDIRWDLAQGSATFWDEGLDALSVVADRPSIATVQQAASRNPVYTADHSEVHLRRREADLDLAISQTNGMVISPEAPNLPAFDLDADLTVVGAAEWLTGGADGQSALELLGGRSGTLRRMEIALAGESGGANLSGDFAFSEDGLLDGNFDLAIDEPDRIADVVGDTLPELENVASAIAQAIPFIGRSVDGRSVISISANDGRLSAGFIPLGEVPPLD